MVVPDRAPRPLGLRHRRAAGAGRHPARRPPRGRRRPTDQDRLALRARSRHRRAALRRGGTRRAAQRHPRRAGVADAAGRGGAAVADAARAADARDRLGPDARGARRVPAVGRAAAIGGRLHAAQPARHDHVSRQRLGHQLGECGVRSGEPPARLEYLAAGHPGAAPPSRPLRPAARGRRRRLGVRRPARGALRDAPPHPGDGAGHPLQPSAVGYPGRRGPGHRDAGVGRAARPPPRRASAVVARRPVADRHTRRRRPDRHRRWPGVHRRHDGPQAARLRPAVRAARSGTRRCPSPASPRR